MPGQTMLADGKQLAGTKMDLGSLVGTWVNSKGGSDYIRRIVVAERDGVLVIRPFGAGEDGEVDWGDVEAAPYVVSGKTEVAGFHAVVELDGVRTELAANEKLGILVIQSYTSFRDGTDRLSHYSREFFHLSSAGVPTPKTGVESLLGRWVNSNPKTNWITGFNLTETDGRFSISVSSATEPHDWGTAEATTYQDNIGEPAFSAVYDLGQFEAILAANTNKGLVIIAAFLRSKGGDQTNFLCREFYFRQG